MITVGYRNLPDGTRAWSVKRPALPEWRLTEDQARYLSATLLLLLAEARRDDENADAYYQSPGEEAAERDELATDRAYESEPF